MQCSIRSLLRHSPPNNSACQWLQICMIHDINQHQSDMLFHCFYITHRCKLPAVWGWPVAVTESLGLRSTRPKKDGKIGCCTLVQATDGRRSPLLFICQLSGMMHRNKSAQSAECSAAPKRLLSVRSLCDQSIALPGTPPRSISPC